MDININSIDEEFFGKVIYDEEGYPICAICGKSFKKLASHVVQKHKITAKEYKKMLGLDLNKGIVCEETKEKLQKAVSMHYDLVVAQNLNKKGFNTRFTYGHKGRTKDKVSIQTYRRLSKQFTK